MSELTHDAYGAPLPPKRKRRAPERVAQRSVVSWLRIVLPTGSIVAAVTNEDRGRAADPMSRARYGQARKAVGVTTGFPDLCILLPGPRTVFLEMKAPKTGRLSEAQIDVHARLRRLGHAVGVATSIDEARDLLRQWGVALKEAAP